MKNPWKKSDKKILEKYNCVELPENGEVCQVGPYGEIWPNSEIEFKALITSSRIAKRYLPKHKWPKDPGDEILINFPSQDLALWIKRLRVPIKAQTQVNLANRDHKNGFIRSNINGPNKENFSSKDKKPTVPKKRGVGLKAGLHIDLDAGTKNLEKCSLAQKVCKLSNGSGQ